MDSTQFITMQTPVHIIDHRAAQRSSEFELAAPSRNMDTLRIFRKGAHIQNIGKSGLTSPQLTDVLHNFSVSAIRATVETMPVPSCIVHPINHDPPLESFWLNRALVDGENPEEFSIILLIEKGVPSHGSWYNVCLFNARTEKYHFRGFCRALKSRALKSQFEERNLYIRHKALAHARDTDFYVDYSNMEAPHTFWTKLKSELELKS